MQHIVLRTAGGKNGIEKSFGQPLLASAEAAEVVERALLHFDGDRYATCAWYVMPNHVHVIVRQAEGWPLHSIIHSWKSFTANEINKALRRSGAVWQRDYFDRYVRDDDELRATIHYVEQNPVAAGLVEHAAAWRWSSAQLRK